MSSPIEKYKEQLKKYIEAREKATEGPWEIDPKFRQVWSPSTELYISTEADGGFDAEAEFILKAANESAQIARDLLDALEALEYYANQSNYEKRETMGGARPPAVLVERGSRASVVLAKLSKGDE